MMLEIRYKIPSGVFILLILVSVGACDDHDPVGPPITDTPHIFGFWALQDIDGVPPGIRIDWRFDKDSSFYEYVNDTLHIKDRYFIVWGYNWVDRDSAQLVTFDRAGRSLQYAIITLTTDTLVLRAQFFDGGKPRYLRIH
jgi:hypothetical protein